MFKLVVCFALVAAAMAVPDPAPKAKPGLVAAAYSTPLVAAAPAVAYSAGYAAPLAYSAPLVGPSVYAAGYSSPLVLG